jgi:hypothetical protein
VQLFKDGIFYHQLKVGKHKNITFGV